VTIFPGVRVVGVKADVSTDDWQLVEYFGLVEKALTLDGKHFRRLIMFTRGF